MFLAFGLAALHFADRDLPMGTLMRMGPGNFPAALGAILAFFGLFIAARGLWNAPPGQLRARSPGIRGRSPDSLREATESEAPSPTAWNLRPVGCIVGAMLVFGFLLPRAGLVPALVAMFLVAAFAEREIRWSELVVMTIAMTLFAIIVFVWLLKLPFQLFPGVYLV